ncbi:MAG TPA: Holliday junction branch migration protein RuvA [Alphaproteobacteria bacterium]|nr:Holliday junction branch migration protein RuvA [Rhodospirillaceae bacterium]HRJ13267.1 Holliday junction branch migration protein RuvA [Alphaproteobacteria bacterium]
MIAQLSGTVSHLADDRLVLDVNGVGYLLQVSRAVLSQGLRGGQSLTLPVETQVREDAITLFGFSTHEEQAWFRLLQTVQGVGARVALAILAILPPENLQLAIAAQDKVQITRADGVGPKLAVRILTELKDKALGPGFAVSPVAALPAAANTNAAQDAISALTNLGYGRSEAAAAIARAAQNLGASAALNDLITSGLKELAA